jgi:hypothetical protein
MALIYYHWYFVLSCILHAAAGVGLDYDMTVLRKLELSDRSSKFQFRAGPLNSLALSFES